VGGHWLEIGGDHGDEIRLKCEENAANFAYSMIKSQHTSNEGLYVRLLDFIEIIPAYVLLVVVVLAYQRFLFTELLELPDLA
jgi:hypothetical protein